MLHFNEVCMCAKFLQSCPTLCDPVDCSPPGSAVHGIPQARILEWVAIPSCRGSCGPVKLFGGERLTIVSSAEKHLNFRW